MIQRLRRRFILIAMAAVTLVTALMALSINLVSYHNVDEELRETLELLADNQGTMPLDFEEFLRGELFQFEGGKREDRPDNRFTVETPFSTRFFVLRYCGDGTLLSADLRSIAAVTEENVDRYLTVALRHGPGFGYTQGSYKFYVVETDEEQYMAIFLDCQLEMRSVHSFALTSFLVVLVCDLMVFVLVLVSSKRAIDPFVKSVEKQKQFITDASHELKTPLTVITTSLKVLEMEVGPQKWIDKIRVQTDKLRSLVGDLVTLSRLDEEKPRLQCARFNISGVVQETADSFRDFSAARQHPLELDVAQGVEFCGDEYAIRQLVSILMDNAVKYAADGSPIRLSMTEGKRKVTLTSENACTEVDPGELPKFFDRFYRADKARAGGGFGVGLSIARGIAEEHGGSIRADLPRAGVIRFTVNLKSMESAL